MEDYAGMWKSMYCNHKDDNYFSLEEMGPHTRPRGLIEGRGPSAMPVGLYEEPWDHMQEYGTT
jgi:hypothetical protein